MKSVEITTTQNVTIEYELASLRERALGLLLDAIIVYVGYLILWLLEVRVFRDIFFENLPRHVVWAIFPLILFFFYNIFFEALNTGQTPGKIATGVKVVRLDGKAPEWSDVLLRSVLHLVDSLSNFGVIGALLIKTTDKAQRFGDMAANTTVIKILSSRNYFRLHDILNIHTLENYQPVFPQVRRLSERDMIFIKTLLTRYQQYPNAAHEIAIEELAERLVPVLGIEQMPEKKTDFLKTLLRDYIVLTR